MDNKGRKISYSYYLISINIVIILLILGAIIYVVVDNKRVLYKQDEYDYLDTNYLSLQLQYTLLNEIIDNPQTSCSALNSALDDSTSDLGYSLDKLLQYQKESINDQQFENLKRKYTLDNVKYWIFAKKAKALCNLDKVIVMYFYDEKCTICPDQGVVLSYYKTKYKENILVFPFDTTDAKKEPILKMIMSVYNITTYPTLIIGDNKYEGIIHNEKLGNIFADEFELFTGNCTDTNLTKKNDTN